MKKIIYTGGSMIVGGRSFSFNRFTIRRIIEWNTT
jgi:hypothetical protein